MRKSPKYQIDQEMNLDYQDAPPWRSYHLSSDGDKFTDLITNATISEIDQDGGSLACYSIADAENRVADRARRIIADFVSCTCRAENIYYPMPRRWRRSPWRSRC